MRHRQTEREREREREREPARQTDRQTDRQNEIGTVGGAKSERPASRQWQIEVQKKLFPHMSNIRNPGRVRVQCSHFFENTNRH